MDRAFNDRDGGLACEQSGVTLDQINDGYNSDLLELYQPFKKGWVACGGAFYYLGFGESGNEKYSELSSTKPSLHLTRSAVCL